MKTGVLQRMVQRRPHLCDYLLNLELIAAAGASGGKLAGELGRLTAAEEEATLGEQRQTGGPEAALAERTTRAGLGASRIVDITDEEEDEDEVRGRAGPEPEPEPAPEAGSVEVGEGATKLKLIQALLPEYAMLAESRADYQSRQQQRVER
jgi:hypothetical protein